MYSYTYASFVALVMIFDILLNSLERRYVYFTILKVEGTQYRLDHGDFLLARLVLVLKFRTNKI